MDPTNITNMLLQVPALGVVVYLVVHFLGYLKSFREDERSFVKAMVKDQSDTITDNTLTLEKVAQVLNENTKTHAQVRVVIEQHLAKCPIAENCHKLTNTPNPH